LKRPNNKPDKTYCKQFNKLFLIFYFSFITRLGLPVGVPRHALRGIVGHTSDAMTDLYSHDLTSARTIQAIPSPPLRPKSAGSGK